MILIDFTKPYMYENTMAFYQGNLSTNNTLRCKLKTGSVEDLTGYACTGTFYVNGVEIVNTCRIVDRAACIVDVILPTNALVAGEHKMEIILTKPKVNTIQSPMIKYEVWQGLTTGEGIEGTAEYPVLVELINSTQSALDDTKELQTEIRATLVIANEEIEKIPTKVQEKVDEITQNIDPMLEDINQNEEIRKANEAERIKAEDIRKANEKERIDAELVREHNDADHEKAEAVRETNEENRRVAEERRTKAEDLRVDAEKGRVAAEQERVEAEQARKDNYNFMTEDEERRRQEENKRIEAEKVRDAAEKDRIAEENRRRTVEDSRVKAETVREANENTRKSNESTRQTNETQRVQAETERSTKYDKLVQDTNNSVNSFNAYVEQAKADEETRKANEVNRIAAESKRSADEAIRQTNEGVRNRQEDIRVARDEKRQSVFDGKVRAMDAKISEGTAKIVEMDTAKNTLVQDTKKAIDKMTEDFNSLSASQQQDAEVILARDGEESLNARLERDLAKGKVITETVEGSYISCNGTVDSYLQNIEIHGNTVQNPEDLSDIKSVGDRVDEQELYKIPIVCCGKNLNSSKNEQGGLVWNSGEPYDISDSYRSADFIRVSPNMEIIANLEVNCGIFEYDKNKKFIKSTPGSNPVVTTSDTRYIKYATSYDKNIQIQEGTKMSAYEPYKEHKLDILSPTQLEKAGDVADRLYFDKEENAWCIEKSITPLDLISCSYVLHARRENTARLRTSDCANKIISNNYINSYSRRDDLDSYYSDVKGIAINKTSSEIFISVLYTDLGVDPSTSETQVANAWRDFVKKNNIIFKYASRTPKKIVLPLDTQIVLSQFLDTTNVFFECGELEGTIKATFSKSITSAVQSNAQAISSIGDRVKSIEGLKDSQEVAYDSSLLTEYKGYVLCTETKNGTVKDLKISGKSLVNIMPDTNGKWTINQSSKTVATCVPILNTLPFEPNTTYTIVLLNTPSKFRACRPYKLANPERDITSSVGKFTTISDISQANERLHLYAKSGEAWTEEDLNKIQIIILKGDHTQNPPKEYFEGIASVGTGVDKIEVSSYGKNLLDISKPIIDSKNTYGYFKLPKTNNNVTISLIDKDSSLSIDKVYLGLTKTGIDAGNGSEISWIVVNGELINSYPKDYSYVSFFPNNKETLDLILRRFDIMVNLGDVAIPYEPYKEDKKPLLFKDTDNTWKPIKELRGLDAVCDTVELHSDGKYYYHIRTKELILQQTDNMFMVDDTQPSTTMFAISGLFKPLEVKQLVGISDKYNFANIYATDEKGMYVIEGNGNIVIRDSKMTLEEMKAKIQANPVKFIVGLAEERVFEVNPLFLEAYEGETMVSIDSGVINAHMRFKLSSYITNIIMINQRRIKELENEIYKSQELQNIMILENDMRLMDLEFALSEITTLNIKLGGNEMLRGVTEFEFLKGRIESGSHTDVYLEKCINKYKKANRLTQEEYDLLYDMIYPPVYDVFGTQE